ncbi:MAG: nucleotidyltransferase domain-containing protein [Archaeoglobaceae archaeon]
MIGYKLSQEEKEEVKNRLSSLLSNKDEIIFAYIHGSFIDAYWFRDLDIAVYLDEKKVSKKALDYELTLSVELEKALKLPVDIKILNYAPLSFRYKVTKGKVVFSRNEEKRYTFLEDTWHRYLDFAPVEKEFMRETSRIKY